MSDVGWQVWLLGQELEPGGGDPFFGAGPIGERGDATVGLAGVIDKIESGFHRPGASADDHGAMDRFVGAGRVGHELRDDLLADPCFGDPVEIPNAIEPGIEIGMGDQLAARVKEVGVRHHAFAGGNGEPARRVDSKGDGHGDEKVSYICSALAVSYIRGDNSTITKKGDQSLSSANPAEVASDL